jgi:hypothetical protein
MYFDLLIATLAVYRVATDLAYMDGPLDLFSRLRGAAVERLGAGHWMTVGLHCPICISFWLALPLAIWFGWAWLAIAGAVTFLVRIGAK